MSSQTRMISTNFKPDLRSWKKPQNRVWSGGIFRRLESLGAIKPAFGRQFEDSQKQKKRTCNDVTVCCPVGTSAGKSRVLLFFCFAVCLVCLALAETFTGYLAAQDHVCCLMPFYIFSLNHDDDGTVAATSLAGRQALTVDLNGRGVLYGLWGDINPCLPAPALMVPLARASIGPRSTLLLCCLPCSCKTCRYTAPLPCLVTREAQ